MKTVPDSWVLCGASGCQAAHIRSAETFTSPSAFSLELSLTELIRDQFRFGSTANFEVSFYCATGCKSKSHCKKYSARK